MAVFGLIYIVQRPRAPKLEASPAPVQEAA
jgi:hypothetical protein